MRKATYGRPERLFDITGIAHRSLPAARLYQLDLAQKPDCLRTSHLRRGSGLVFERSAYRASEVVDHCLRIAMNADTLSRLVKLLRLVIELLQSNVWSALLLDSVGRLVCGFW